ncbi:hypothetical protein [Deinococcus ruber]|uniref:Uncharacterized protein n=1 Tax=Deinococcus ruber TaxID=1848197 RepID=A0A918C9G2_9DEIO|nr:hypothetical protein [Deinococcus ruber]GGR11426.1 hypothetical protein GCM10008957_25270 [Deinococcus ruber]
MKLNGIEYGGQDNNALTFTMGVGVVAGDAVTVKVAGTADRGTSGDPLYGKASIVERDGRGAVERDGIVIFPYAGTLNPGYQQLAVNGLGKVIAGTGGNGRWAWVLGTDSTLGNAVIDLG